MLRMVDVLLPLTRIFCVFSSIYLVHLYDDDDDDDNELTWRGIKS